MQIYLWQRKCSRYYVFAEEMIQICFWLIKYSKYYYSSNEINCVGKGDALDLDNVFLECMVFWFIDCEVKKK
jgi:hypothetical protein